MSDDQMQRAVEVFRATEREIAALDGMADDIARARRGALEQVADALREALRPGVVSADRFEAALRVLESTPPEGCPRCGDAYHHNCGDAEAGSRPPDDDPG